MKIIKIENCLDCPFYQHAEAYGVCNNLVRTIDGVIENFEIPEWCPLENNNEAT
jgi:hypothetical protein